MATYTDNYQLTMPTYAETADIATVNHNMILIDDIMHSSQVSLADAYDSTQTYNTDDVVMYEMLMYKCLADNVTGTWDAQYWERTTASECGGGGGTASEITYDNTTSGMTATNVQEAIDELEGNIEDVSDGLDDAVESLAPAYDPTETYNEGDIVSKDNKLHQCNTDNTTGDWDSTKWDEYVISEHMGEGGSTVTITPETIAEPKQKIADFEIDGASGSLYAPIVVIDGDTSGAIASFPDGSANPIKSLDFSIEPIQEGSGDPSPENVRPISGWTGVNINVSGKNLINESAIIWENEKYLAADGSKANNSQYRYTANYLGCKGNNIYSIQANKQSTYDVGISVCYYDLNKDFISRDVIIHSASQGVLSGQFTTPANCFFIRFNAPLSSNNIQIEVGSTATDYEPYNGTDYTIPFKDSQGDPLTIYGGKVHIRRVNGVWSGEVVETEVHAFISDLNLTRSKASSWSGYLFYSDISNKSTGSSLMCSSYKYSNHGTTTVENLECIRSANTSYIYFRDDSYSDVETFKQGNEGQKIVYELATPNTYPIDPANIPNIVTLLGDNNMFADTGDIDEVIYIRDLNLAFNELWDLVHSNSGTRSLSSLNLSKSAVKEEETKEESKEEEKEEEETKEEER